MAKNIVENEIKNEEVNKVVETVESTEEAKEVEIRILTLEEFQDEVSIKTYVDITAKRAIIDTMIAQCIYRQDDMYYINYLNRDIAFDLAILNFYTDFVMDEHISYDNLKEIGAFEYIQDCAIETYDLNDIINRELDQMVKVYNSIGGVVSRKVDVLISKMPDTKDLSKLVNKLPTIINKINPDVIKILTNELKNSGIQNQVSNKEKSFDADDVKKILDLQKTNKSKK